MFGVVSLLSNYMLVYKEGGKKNKKNKEREREREKRVWLLTFRWR